LERAELVTNNMNVNYASWELRKDGKFERVGNTGDLALTEKEYYLRLERRDGEGVAGVSADGVRWASLEAHAGRVPQRVLVGGAAGRATTARWGLRFIFRSFVSSGRQRSEDY